MSKPPEPGASRPRRIRRRLVGGAALALTVLVATAPWWIPALAVGWAAAQGVSIDSWGSAGWRGVEFRGIRVHRANVDIAIDRVRAPRFGLFPPPAAGETAIEVGHVRVRVTAPAAARDRTEPALPDILAQIDSGWRAAQRWLPSTRVQRIEVQASGTDLELRDLHWDGSVLRAQARSGGRSGTVVMRRGSEARAFAVAVEAPDQHASLELALAATPEGGARLGGTARWRDTPIELAARFGSEGLIPVSAEVRADAVSLPSEALGLPGYGPVTGALHAAWSENAFTLAVQAEAEPGAGSEWPRASLEMRASGSLARLRIEVVEVRIPGLEAALSQPLEIVLDGRVPTTPAEFALEADLGAWPQLGAAGRIRGSARVLPAAEGEAQIQFSVAGTDLSWREVEGAALAVHGRWDRLELVLETARVTFSPDAVAEASLAYDIPGKAVKRAVLQAALPGQVLRALAPDGPPAEHLDLRAEAEGPVAALQHRGAATLTGLEWTRDRRLGGSLRWQGEGVSAAVDGQLALPGGGTLPFAVSGRRTGDGNWSGVIEQVRWMDAEGEWWRLIEPVEAGYQAAEGTLTLAPWRIQGQDFLAAGEARLAGPAAGMVSLSVDGLEGRRFGGVLPEPIRGGRIERAELRAHWNRGPVHVEGRLRAIYAPVAKAEYAVEGEFVTREGALALGSIQVQDAGGTVLRGSGRLPLLMEGTDAGFRVDLMRDQPIALELESVPNPVFWDSIAELTGWAVEDPRLSCRLHGTLDDPRGEVDLAAATVHPPSRLLGNGGRLPRFAGLHVRVAADESGLALTHGMVAIDYRWLTLAGRAPWSVWRQWRETGAVDWRSTAFELASNPLPIAIASRAFPTQLAPEGEVSVHVSHRPEEGFGGRIWLHGAMVRPIGPLGSIRDINSEVHFEGRTLSLTRLEGFLGGQPVWVTGEASLADPDRLQYRMRVRCSRVPLVRRAGLIVRTEVDLELQQGPAGPPRITGRVDFGPSLYSSDLLELLPSGVDRPEQRPPYFAVEEEPLSGWVLDVAAHGEAFLRVNTPFYKDLLSLDARITGTLGEPRIEGWVWGTGGVVSFPFGRIPVKQVLVTLSRENPFEPQLAVHGAGRVLGYDIQMEASGPASEPRLLFTSDPPLSSQQVFLMLTTGAVPDDTHSIGSSERASRLAMFLGRNLAAGLGIGSSPGGDDRLEIRSGEDFTRQGRETVIVQYDIDGRWSLVGEYDRFDAYNAGIKFRLINR